MPRSSETSARRASSTTRSPGTPSSSTSAVSRSSRSSPSATSPRACSEGELDEHNARLVEALQRQGDVWVAPARVDGKVCLRPCVVNYRTTDDDVRAFVDAVLDAGRALAQAGG